MQDNDEVARKALERVNCAPCRQRCTAPRHPRTKGSDIALQFFSSSALRRDGSDEAVCEAIYWHDCAAACPR